MNQHPELALQRRIDKKALKELYKTRPHIHLLAMIFEWGLIIGSIAICINFFHPVLYFATVVFIGSRVHGLAILMHDVSHHRFFKNRKLSDLITNLFVMFPIFSTLRNYRQNHLRHHQHLNTDQDPDWVAKEHRKDFTFPMNRWEYYWRVFSYLFFIPGISDALWFLKRFGVPNKVPVPSYEKFVRIGFYLTLIVVLSVFGWWAEYAMYWLVPYTTTFYMFQYIRSAAEHFGDLEYENEMNSTRSVKPTFLESFLVAPYNVHFHIEHHLYPAVPFYNLPKLHALLNEDEAFSQTAHITHGYARGFVNELVR